MNNLKFTIAILLSVCTSGVIVYTHYRTEYVIKEVKEYTKQEHQLYHDRMIDSVKMHSYYKNSYSGNYNIQLPTVVIKCDKN